jgi:hypothetical protein
MSFRQRSVTYVKSFLCAFTRKKRYPTCFKFRFVPSLYRGKKRKEIFNVLLCFRKKKSRLPPGKTPPPAHAFFGIYLFKRLVQPGSVA